VTGGWTGTCSIGGEAGSLVELGTQISNLIGLRKIILKFFALRLSECDDVFVSNSPIHQLFIQFINYVW
jgi:hypothetical protein